MTDPLNDPTAGEPAPKEPTPSPAGKPEPGGLFRRPPRKAEAQIRTDLMEPAVAWAECKKRMANALPDLPAFVLVIIFGTLGAILGWAWHLRINVADGNASAVVVDLTLLGPGLTIGLGIAGAVAAVFLLAKTDTSKLIHCSLVALFSGMVGPALVIKALLTVADIKPGSFGSALAESATTGANSAQVSSKQAAQSIDQLAQGSSSPSDVSQQVAKATTSATNSLASVGDLQTTDPKAAGDAAATISTPLKNTLGNFAKVLPQSEDAILAVREIRTAAEKAGVRAVAQKAQEILDANADNPFVKKVLDRLTAPLCFMITPPELDDDQLLQLKAQLQELNPSWKIKPTVHPSRPMDDGIEVVYYNEADGADEKNKATADKILDYLKKYFTTTSGSVRKGTLENGEKQNQFDLHIGPDAASNYLKKLNAPKPPAPVAAPAATSVPAATPIPGSIPAYQPPSTPAPRPNNRRPRSNE